jgi:hypothetical protein
MNSFGAIFRRAVTLYVRNVALSVPALLPAAPVAAVQLVVLRHESAYRQVLVQAQHQPRAVALTGLTDAPVLTAGTIAWIVLLALLEVVLMPFLWAAVAAGVRAIDAGEYWDPRVCIASAFRKAPALVTVAFAQMLIVFAGAFAAAVAVAVPFALSVAVAHHAPSAAVVPAATVLAMAVLWFAATIVWYVAVAFAANSVVLEDIGPWHALASGIRRVFNRREFFNALFVAGAVVLIAFAAAAASGVAIAFFSHTLHSEIAAIAASTLLSIVQMTFVALVLAVYYFDVRMRREGCDLQAAVDRLRAQSARGI